MKNILRFIAGVFALIILAGAVNALLSSSFMMELLKKKLDKPNPTSYVFDRSIGEVDTAIRNYMRLFPRMHLETPGESTFTYDFSNDSWRNNFLLPPRTYSLQPGLRQSYVYRTNGRGRYYQFNMFLYLDSLGPHQTRVRVETEKGGRITSRESLPGKSW